MNKISVLLLICVVIYGSSKKASVNQNKSLDKHCVKCHIMYYPEFLPERSWELLFTDKSLANHFGDNVTLEHNVKKQFLTYYLKYSSDKKINKLAKIINRSVPKSSTPLRLIKTPYHEDKHEDLKDEMVLENNKVKSYSNCKACHKEGYDKAIFDEDEVDIPNWTKGFFGWKRK